MNQVIEIDLAQALTAVEDAPLFTSLCTIKRPAGTLDAAGQPDLSIANFVDVPGLVSIACMASPEVLLRPDRTDEVKLITETIERNVLHVLLDGHYPQIQQIDLAVIDGIAYDILSVENDSQGITTRLACQLKTL